MGNDFMTPCTFGEFYAGCKDRLTDIQLRVLKPEIMYFRYEDTYFGVIEDPRGVWLDILVGRMPGIWAFRRLMDVAKVPRVGFLCREGSTAEKIAQYYGAEIEDSGQMYADGCKALRCVINTQQTRRLNKTGAKEQALI